MALLKDVFLEALERGKLKMIPVNRGLLEVKAATKKKPGHVKCAVNDELGTGLLTGKVLAFILYADADELNAIADELDQKTSKGE